MLAHRLLLGVVPLVVQGRPVFVFGSISATLISGASCGVLPLLVTKE